MNEQIVSADAGVSFDGAGVTTVRDIAIAAQRASRGCATTSIDTRNAALQMMADTLRAFAPDIIAQNERDMDAARVAGTADSLLDRLMLDDRRIEGMAGALEQLLDLPDPVGVVQQETTMHNGIRLSRVSVPLGVVAMVYEARPNVTADAAGICVKSGNACVLRGGSMAFHSCRFIAHILHDAAVAAGMPRNCICMVETTDRSATDELLHLRGIVDVLIPRGGAGLIRHCVENAIVPVIETGVGNCHLYVHAPADYTMARDIAINAKCQRPGVCNAAESLLVDRSIANEALAVILAPLAERGVKLHCDSVALEIAKGLGIDAVAATEDDWGREYLGLEMSVACVDGLDEAIEHIDRYGTGHSESIITDDRTAAEEFLARIDAAAVYWNASTRFTDGGEFGLGAEIGISTQKLHTRGPFALQALTSYKYVLRGSGQVRG